MSIISKRIQALDAFKAASSIDCISRNSDEVYFSRSGCDTCGNNVANNVMECTGYSAATGSEYDIELCLQCLCVEYNGFDSDAEIEYDNDNWSKDNE